MDPHVSCWRTTIWVTAAVAAGVLLALIVARPLPGLTSGPGAPPMLEFPWQDGQAWRTGMAGYHGSKDALDFLPPDSPLGTPVLCEGEPGWVASESQYWVVAAGPGVVAQAGDSAVVIDHGNGWSSGYYHLSSLQVNPGDAVPPEWVLGRASNYGDCSTGPQVHFWVQGPNGETIRNTLISGRDANQIALNEVISDTGNTPPGPAPTPTFPPTPATTAGASPSSAPTNRVLLKGDIDCDSDIDAVDSLRLLRYTSGVVLPPLASCPYIGDHPWGLFGDLDCDFDIDAVDALRALRHTAALSSGLPSGCREIGS